MGGFDVECGNVADREARRRSVGRSIGQTGQRVCECACDFAPKSEGVQIRVRLVQGVSESNFLQRKVLIAVARVVAGVCRHERRQSMASRRVEKREKKIVGHEERKIDDVGLDSVCDKNNTSRPSL